MIQHTYNVQAFNDGNKIIQPVLSDEYEALLGCLIEYLDDIVMGGKSINLNIHYSAPDWVWDKLS
ncbi:hypothetical protein DXB54_01675 [Coprococcus sp. OM04-5BH]|jgi:hypothetical protein|nr:hypothetical protein DXB54_01675 [Coprococcus sp. OM04-5BH]